MSEHIRNMYANELLRSTSKAAGWRCVAAAEHFESCWVALRSCCGALSSADATAQMGTKSLESVVFTAEVRFFVPMFPCSHKHF